MLEPDSTSLSLLQRLQKNEQTAWSQLEELYTPLVQRWCLRFSVPENAVPDVTQNLFIAVLAGIDTFERRRTGSFRKWLRQLTYTQSMDYLRKLAGRATGAGGTDAMQRLQNLVATEPTLDDASDQQERSELWRAAAKAVHRGEGESAYTAFLRSAIYDDRAIDIAADLGVTVSAVYQARARIARRLRQEFELLIDDDPASSD